MSSLPPALLAAAVKAACQAGAPRRTVQAVAAAVAGACLQSQVAAPRTGTGRPAGARAEADAPKADAADADLSALVGLVRSKRAARRRAKKVRMKEAKQAAQPVPPVLLHEQAADQCPEDGGDSGAVSALACPPGPTETAQSEQLPAPRSLADFSVVTQENLRGTASAASGAASAVAPSAEGVPSEPSEPGTLRTFGGASAASSRAQPYVPAPHVRGRDSSGGTGKGRPAPSRR